MGQRQGKEPRPDVAQLETLYREHQDDWARQVTLLQENAENLSPDRLQLYVAGLQELQQGVEDLSSSLGLENLLEEEKAAPAQQLAALQRQVQALAHRQATLEARQAALEARLQQQSEALQQRMLARLDKARGGLRRGSYAVLAARALSRGLPRAGDQQQQS